MRKDKPVAFRGLAKLWAEQVGDVYRAGLWKGVFLEQLLWTVTPEDIHEEICYTAPI